MKLERTENAIRNTKWGFVQIFASIFLPFVVRTIMIMVLSAEYAGLSSLFTSVLSVLNLSELGFSNAIVYSMYKPVAEDNKEKIRALLNLYRKAYLIIGTVILTIGLAMMPILPHLIEGDAPNEINIYILYCIYLFNSTIGYFFFGYKTSILSAYQREDLLSKNALICSVVLNLIQCCVLLLFRDYYLYAIVIPLSTLLLSILNYYTAEKMFPDYKPEGKLDKEEINELKRNIGGLVLWKIGGATRNTFDSIVVSMYLGLVTVAIYNNYFYIINGVNAFLGVIVVSITAGVGNKIVTDSPEENYADFRKFQFYYNWIAGLCTVYLLCLYQPFMSIWMGKDLMFHNSIVFLFCYYFLMMQQGNINSVYYHAAGLWWHGRLRSIIEAILNLALNLILGKMFGVAGIILATIVSFTCINIYGSKFVFTEYFKNNKVLVYFAENYYSMFVVFISGMSSFILLEFMSIRFEVSQIIKLVLGIIISTVIPNVIFFFVYSRNKRYKAYISEMIRNGKKMLAGR